jgi:ElaB/YqjD/DUF883 family membrane-anchored ribosome-binding protein
MAHTTGKAKESTENQGSRLEEALPEYVNQAKQVASDVYETVSDKTREFAEKAKDATSDARENVGDFIEKHPTQSFFIGLGIGCLIGFTVTAILKD